MPDRSFLNLTFRPWFTTVLTTKVKR